MIWIPNKQQLQFYNMRCNLPCYCELLVYPSDLILQGSFAKGSGDYTLSVEVWSVDGNAALEVVTDYFDYFIGYNRFTGRDYFSIKLKGFSPVMCSNGCFLIRVGVLDNATNAFLFANFTERYCIADCCDFARDITVTQSGNDITTGYSVPTITPGSAYHCGVPIIRLVTTYDCYDVFTGDLYNIPTTIYTGDGFSFYRVTNFRGKFKERPREINRDVSFNCRLLKTETEKVYVLEGFEYFPSWKMSDMENQLMSAAISVDDFKQLWVTNFNGGSPFTLFNDCCEVFKLKTTLNDCVVRQYHGCGDTCNNDTFGDYSLIFALPQQGLIYSEQGNLIGTDKASLITYFNGYPGVIMAEEIAQSPPVVDAYALVGIKTDSIAPSSIYVGGTKASNRVFGLTPQTLQEIADTLVQGCAMPVIGSITVEQIICDAPALGSIIVTGATSLPVLVNPYGDWAIGVTPPGEASGGIARFDLLVYNMVITQPDPMEPVYLSNVGVAVVNVAGRPMTPQILNSSNNANIPANVIISVDQNGLVSYNGKPTAGDGTEITIDIPDLTYNLT